MNHGVRQTLKRMVNNCWRAERATRAIASASAVACLIGCTSSHAQVSNQSPVGRGMSPSPIQTPTQRPSPRTSEVIPAGGSIAATRDAIQRAGFDPRPGVTSAVHIIARVDNEVILLEDVKAPIGRLLEEARAQLPPQKYREVEWDALRRATMEMVDRKLLLRELEIKAPNKEGVARVRRMMELDFENQLAQMARQAGLNSKDEFKDQLRKENLSVNAMRNNMVEGMLARIALEQMTKNKVPEPSREELYNFYLDHVDDFKERAGVIWRQIEIKKGTDQQAALQKITKIRQSLADGQAFADVAKKVSEGPTAIDGGKWSLTSKAVMPTQLLIRRCSACQLARFQA